MAKTKIAYITLLDQYHPGIYDSQVIDVCHYLQEEFGLDVQLIAFLSIRELMRSNAKKQIKAKYPNSLVLPAFPKLKYFKMTRFLLALVLIFNKKRGLICRNVFATQIGLACKHWGLVATVVFDGRSALAAEIKEYDVFPVPYFRENIAQWEKKAVLETDGQLAISNQLVQYWTDRYGYDLNKFSIVPCTLHSQLNWSYSLNIPKPKGISVVYAGSNAPWQGFDQIARFLTIHKEVHCTLLTRQSAQTDAMLKAFPGRLTVKWVGAEMLAKELSLHDYGLLLRPQSVTNKVASPGKFAEYLACGLPVIITSNLGDYSAFVTAENCGLVWDGAEALNLTETDEKIKKHCHQLSNDYFKKPKLKLAYQKLINHFL